MTGPAGVVVGIDGSPRAAAALMTALEEGVRRGETVTAVFAYPAPGSWGATGNAEAGEPDRLATAVLEEAGRFVDEATMPLPATLREAPLELRVRAGSPAPVLAEAARGASRVHLTLSDDAAVDDVLERAAPGFAPGVVIVDHTTTSATGTAARAARWAERGVAFQHAPVFMGPQNALESTGIMLASGDPARFEALRPALEKMTGKLVYLGPAPEKAASFKLLGNLFLMFLTAGMAEMLNLAKALDVAPKDAAALFDAFNPGSMVPARMARMIGGDFAHPSWELSMARKDARLMIEGFLAGFVIGFLGTALPRLLNAPPLRRGERPRRLRLSQVRSRAAAAGGASAGPERR